MGVHLLERVDHGYYGLGGDPIYFTGVDPRCPRGHPPPEEEKRAHLFKVHVSLQSTNDDALVLNQIGQGYARDRVLVEDCEVRGGGDGVMINASGVRLLRCRIIGAYSRGIFANPDFVIEDSTAAAAMA